MTSRQLKGHFAFERPYECLFLMRGVPLLVPIYYQLRPEVRSANHHETQPVRVARASSRTYSEFKLATLQPRRRKLGFREWQYAPQLPDVIPEWRNLTSNFNGKITIGGVKFTILRLNIKIDYWWQVVMLERFLIINDMTLCISF